MASCEEKRYPPRIKLEVHSDRARRDVVTTVAFQGSVEQQGKESANFPIRLLCPSKGGLCIQTLASELDTYSSIRCSIVRAVNY